MIQRTPTIGPDLTPIVARIRKTEEADAERFVLVDRARFERLLACAQFLKDTTTNGFGIRPVTPLRALQPGDLDPLPEPAHPSPSPSS